jgi:serine/threonine protein kinase
MQARRLGSYELIRRLGEGGMARVYLARDIRLGREVAIKVLEPHLAERPGFRERFLREARVAASLDHPHIVPLYDFGESDSLLYLVMPYVSGGSLQDMLKRAPMPVAEVVSYGSQIADALDYAHQRKVIHRDVKPANMLVHADGRLMLSDFGLAKILDTSRPNVSRGHPDAGTPEYMAPEQIEGHTDERSDVYALGVVLYLLLTGHLPFTGSTSSAVMEGHLYRLPDPPRQLNPAVTPAIQSVVLQALAKHADDRYQRAGDLSAALLAALVAGDAEPLPFSFEGDMPQPMRSPMTPRDSIASRPLTPSQLPPAPLPWEVPPARPSRESPPRSPGVQSRPIKYSSEAFGDLMALEQEAVTGRVSPGPAMLDGYGGQTAPQLSGLAETTRGRMPALGLSSGVSPISGRYSPVYQPGTSQSNSLSNSLAPHPLSGSMPGVSGISQVTGPYPVAMPPAMPASSVPQQRPSVWPRLWFWLAILLMVLLLGVVIALRWFQGHHAVDTGAIGLLVTQAAHVYQFIRLS